MDFSDRRRGDAQLFPCRILHDIAFAVKKTDLVENCRPAFTHPRKHRARDAHGSLLREVDLSALKSEAYRSRTAIAGYVSRTFYPCRFIAARIDTSFIEQKTHP